MSTCRRPERSDLCLKTSRKYPTIPGGPAARYILFGYRVIGWVLWYLPLMVLGAFLFFVTTAVLHVAANPDELVPVGFAIFDAVPSYVGFVGQRVWNRTKDEARARWR